MSSGLFFMTMVMVIFALSQGAPLGFTELFKGITEDEHEYDDVMKMTVTNLRPMSASNKALLWENAIVPYEISEKYSEKDKKLIKEVMEEFHKKTCVRFRPRKGEASHIFLEPGENKGCSTILGKSPNKVNKVNLSKEGCLYKGIIIHELMHALGIIHEQNRPDRDQYVKVDFDNIKKGFKHNFNKYKEGEVSTFGQSYDYDSVMHYGAYDFAIDRKKMTITPLKEGVRIGQRKGFSEKDLIKINRLYKCS